MHIKVIEKTKMVALDGSLIRREEAEVREVT